VALLLATLPYAAHAQSDAKWLIVHADDLGMAHAVNAASIKALETGLVSSASIMVPCPWFPEIAAYARNHPDADLGLHLTLTSEWTSFRWGPVLTKERARSLFDSSGYFYATESEAATHIEARQAEAEIHAQIARARAAGIHPTHLDTHMGTLYQNKALFEALLRVAREEKIPARVSRAHAEEPFRKAVLRPDDLVIDRIISIDADVPPERWSEWYTEAIRKIEPGITEIIVHLAYDDEEMRAITVNHPAWGAAWRQRDFDFITSEEFRRLLRENDIHLISWRDIAKMRGAASPPRE
jgi:hypothetical protein